MKTKSQPNKTMDDLIFVSRQKFADMSPSFRNIATYVVDHRRELAFVSAARVGALTGSSAATVVRFGEYLGLTGFAELQSIAQADLYAEVNTVSMLESTVRTFEPASLLATAIRADIANLEAMLTELQAEEFENAVAMLNEARRIYLVGLRSSFGLMLHLQAYLSWIGRTVVVLKPGVGDLPDQLMDIGHADVCVAFSQRRYARATVEIAKSVKDKGARILGITDSPVSPIACLSDEHLLVPVDFPTFFDSKTAAMTMMNALIFGLAVADRARSLAALKRLEEVWYDQKTYVNYESFRARLAENVAAFAQGGQTARRPHRPTQKPVRGRK